MYEQFEPAPQRHEMILETTHSSGAEEWYCPTCGRRLSVQLPEGCETLALERGDKYAIVWGARLAHWEPRRLCLT